MKQEVVFLNASEIQIAPVEVKLEEQNDELFYSMRCKISAADMKLNDNETQGNNMLLGRIYIKLGSNIADPDDNEAYISAAGAAATFIDSSMHIKARKKDLALMENEVSITDAPQSTKSR